jgi:vitamin B12 transporter
MRRLTHPPLCHDIAARVRAANGEEMKQALLISAVTLTAISPFATAAETAMKPIIVTATRTAETADETLAPVSVITREDIERRQAKSVEDLLRGETGITLTNNGGVGKNTSLFLRGTNSTHVLVLIDGVKVSSATSGMVAFQDLPVSQIDRIEIVRGPRSSLYGSEAIGGVIQIFTRRGSGPATPTVTIGGGSHDTFNTSTGVSGGGEKSWYSVSAAYFGTKGFNACDGRPNPGGAGCFTVDPDKDGYRNTSGSLRAGYRLGETTELDANWMRVKGENRFDGTTQNNSNTFQNIVGAKLRTGAGDPWRGTFAVGQSRDESDNFNNTTFSSRFNTKRDTASVQNDFSIGAKQLVTLGYDYQNDRVSSTTAYPITSRDNQGIFGQYQGGFGSHELQLSIRQDDNEQFGDHTTGSAAWGYELTDSLKLTLSYGTAFRAPTFNELYFPGFGNPTLPPEESRNTEIGLKQTLGNGHWSLGVFENKIDNLIGFDSTATSVQMARIRGLEAITQVKLGEWDIGTNLTLLDPTNQSQGPNNGKLLARRAKQSARIELDRSIGAYRVGTALRAESHRYDDLPNTRRLAGYGTVDLRAEYAISKDWTLQAKMANVLDKDYENVSFFNQEGRSYYFTLRYQPVTTP